MAWVSEQSVLPSDRGDVFFSVCISTRNHAQSLRRTLTSALELDEPSGRFEILVVDNASADDTQHVVSELQQRFPDRPLRYLFEDRVGLHHARHAAARSSLGEILVFSDDDATFDSGWLPAFERAFRHHPEMVAAGGPVRPVWETPPPQWLLDYIGDAALFPVLALMEPHQEFQLGTKEIFFGVNMAIRKNTLYEFGGFRPELVGSRTIGSGEWGLLLALQKQEQQIGHVPEALVYHHIPPHRMTIDYIRSWASHAAPAEMFERWHGRQRRPLGLGTEVARIVYHHWWDWVRNPFIRRNLDPGSIGSQFRAYLGYWKLRYLRSALTDPLIGEALDSSHFGLNDNKIPRCQP